MTKISKVGELLIGGGNKISVQTMYTEPILNEKVEDVLSKIDHLRDLGCSLLRFSYTNINEENAFKEIVSHSSLPLVADIHFDYRLALSAIEIGFDGVRINPGNIGKKENYESVVKSARDNGKAIRIGLNSASLPKDIKRDDISKEMVNIALEYLDNAESWGFTNCIVSLKSSSIDETIKINKLFSTLSNYPLHIGLTEAGSVVSSSVRSTLALSSLLKDGIGDTLRVSINGKMEDEVRAGKEILRSLDLDTSGVKIIACPMCGRHSFDTISFLQDTEDEIYTSKKNITIAVMGCSVNGPGEARKSDYAITGNGRKIFIYKKGEVYLTLPSSDLKNAEKVFLEVINE